MNKTIRRVLLGCMILLAITTGICAAIPFEMVATGDEPIRDTGYAVQHWVSRNVIQDGVEAINSELTNKIEKGGTAVYSAQIPKAGNYRVYVEYCLPEQLVSDNIIEITCEKTKGEAVLSAIWADAEGGYPVDPYGNELAPEQIGVDAMVLGAIEDYADPALDAFIFELPAGEQKIEITAKTQAMEVANVWFVPEKNLPDYMSYRDSVAAAPDNGELEILEAEKYSIKSDSFVRGGNFNNPSLYPYNTFDKLINVLEPGSFKQAGQKVLWVLEVEKDGWYTLSFKYNQYSDANKPVYRAIEVDGEIPCKEMEAVMFPPTAPGKYVRYTPQFGGEEMQIYLTAGRHTLAMEAVMGPLKEAFDSLTAIMREINELGMDLQKLTAGVEDKDRTWDMDVYLPDAVPRVEKCAEELRNTYHYLEGLQAGKPTYADYLLSAADTLDDLAEEPRKLPNKTKLLNVGDNSVTMRLGTTIGRLTEMPFGMDQIYLSSGAELPREKVNVANAIGDGVRAFVGSFIPELNGDYAASSKDKEELTVWVNRPIQYVQALQQLVDAEYNQKYGTNIRLSLMPNEQKLILSNASGTSPDVVLGVNYWTPFDFAARDAAKDLTEYDDFLEFYAEQYNLESLVPLFYNGGVYGAAETQDFQVMYYRKDIMEALDMEVPDTWDDVKGLMPTMLRYNMNFNVPLANLVGFKTYHVTAPFIYQNGGGFYGDDGMSTSIRDEETVKGFEEMTEIFSIYGAQQSVPSFFQNFRFGTVPIGISGFSTYMQLQEAAPELKGQWDIALVPGTKTEDGEVLRYQMADSTACMIFKNTEQPDEAWRFLKWWLSKETQIQYAYNLRASFGPEYQWNTANLQAFRELPYPEEHKKVILKQLESQKENLRHPANYMVEREVSNVWNEVVVNGTPLMEALDKAVMISDREILRKMQEFGFCDENGNILKDYPTDAYYQLLKMLEEKKGESS